MIFLNALDAFRKALVRMVHNPWVFMVGYHARRRRRWWGPVVLMGHLDFMPPPLLLLPHQTVLEFLILPLEVTHVLLLLLEKQRVVSFSHLFADGPRLVEGGIDKGVIIRGATGAATLPDEIETSSSRFARIGSPWVSFLNLKATI